jgi:hypothetical protein
MSIRFVAFAMAPNFAVSILAWESGRAISARAQTEDCEERLSDFQLQVSKCPKEATSLPSARDYWKM